MLLGTLSCCLSSCTPSRLATPIHGHLQEIRSESEPIHSKEKFTAAENAYVSHYGLDQEDSIKHRFGYCERGGYKIALHWYEPPTPKRIVVISHGYYDHSGTWKHAIPALLEAGNTVVIYDQPGHGLSNGKRATIDDFQHYVDVLEEVLNDCQRRSRLPIVLAGHSMGCAIITDYLLDRGRDFEPAQTVFLAPLIRSAFWGPSKFGHGLLAWATPSIPRVYRKNSSNPTYLDFVRQDPLHHPKVPLDWIDALLNWNKRIESFPPAQDVPIRILQGAKDGTAAWKYNLEFISQKFPDSTVSMFAEGRHQLLNESAPIRKEVLQELVDAIDSLPPSKLRIKK